MTISASDIKYPARYAVQTDKQDLFLCSDHLQELENCNREGEVIPLTVEYLTTKFVSCTLCVNDNEN